MDEIRGPEQGDPQLSEAASEASPGIYPATYEPAPGGSYQPNYDSAPLPTAQSLPVAQSLAAVTPASTEPAATPAPPAPESLPQSQPGPATAHRCPWCSAATPPGATHCPSCQASLAERESLGDILVPGVTGIDPYLVHRHDTMNKVMSVPGAKLGAISGTLGIGLSIAATLATEMERRSEERTRPRPLRIGVPPSEALELAERLDKASEAGYGGAVPPAEASQPNSAAPDPAPEMSPWADTPWAAEIPPVLAEPEDAAGQTIEPVPGEADN
ncbi:MAG TPA: hypothetical protein VF337_09890 [Candidatus Limnocylindrales bacterium]